MTKRNAEQLRLWVASHCFDCRVVQRTGRRIEYYAVEINIPFSLWEEDKETLGIETEYALSLSGAREILGY